MARLDEGGSFYVVYTMSDVATAKYPLDGEGALTTTAGSSHAAGYDVLLDRVVAIQPGVATPTISITPGTGVAVTATMPSTLNAQRELNFGPNGLRMVNGITLTASATDATLAVLITYRRVRRTFST